jgi:hypothetical protein
MNIGLKILSYVSYFVWIGKGFNSRYAHMFALPSAFTESITLRLTPQSLYLVFHYTFPHTRLEEWSTTE